MSIKTFLIEKKDLEGGLVHPSGTLLLKLIGQESIKASMASLMTVLSLSPDEVGSLYRFENPFVWFLVPNSPRVRARILGKTFGTESTLKVEVSTIEDEKVKITLHWVAPTIVKNKIIEIFQSFSEEGSKVEPVKLGNSDKWAAWLKIKKGTEVPHYIHLKYVDDPRVYKVLITIPGRRQQCWHCGQDKHWSNQCPNRTTLKGKGKILDKKQEHNAKGTYASVLRGEEPVEKSTKQNAQNETQKDTWLERDGFTLVGNHKRDGAVANTVDTDTKGGDLSPTNPIDKKKTHKKMKTMGDSSTPTSPTKLTRKRTLSSSSDDPNGDTQLERTNEDPRLEEERGEEEGEIEENSSDSSTKLVIDEGGSPTSIQ
ncbi:uncharacterized protein LOC129922336 [Biomphalaria glabrata]|uniref:Uncharacterized protein LOC129922336 n=1 Tax=Biomphalaria glabrata TaxID=6526 RepID=A0A9W2YMS1_BIOGL|nr:uncharacterized protein LOC129922336 [Biomphalaria glabrata]